MNIKLNEACALHHAAVIKKGFTAMSVAEKLMLIVSELSEALEADRKKQYANMSAYDQFVNSEFNNEFFESVEEKRMAAFRVNVKDTFQDEIADTFLRLMDLCGEYQIDIERHIKLKAEYNETRPYKHGKEY
jgi:NTP pyrophosphatase (non-canonical NTP hydrolase)